jgi:antirestriction protein ArdC
MHDARCTMHDVPYSAHNGIPYKGINVVMLWSAAVTKGYACPLWLTFKQALELGGHVRKGQK